MCLEEKQLLLSQITDTQESAFLNGLSSVLTALWGDSRMALGYCSVCVCVCVCVCVYVSVSVSVWLTGRIRLLFFSRGASCLATVYLQVNRGRQMNDTL